MVTNQQKIEIAVHQVMSNPALTGSEFTDIDNRAWDVVAALGQKRTAKTGCGVEYRLYWNEMDILGGLADGDAKEAFYQIQKAIQRHPLYRRQAEKERRDEFRANLDAGDSYEEAEFFSRHPQ